MSKEVIKENRELTIRRACMNFGVWECAKKLNSSKQDITMLVDILIGLDMVKQAYIVAKQGLGELDLKKYSSDFGKL